MAVALLAERSWRVVAATGKAVGSHTSRQRLCAGALRRRGGRQRTARPVGCLRWRGFERPWSPPPRRDRPGSSAVRPGEAHRRVRPVPASQSGCGHFDTVIRLSW